MKQPVSIQINDKIFNSLYSAGKYFNINVGTLSTLVRKGITEYKGLKIVTTTPVKSMPVRTHKSHGRNPNSCPVICETTGFMYKTITAAAKHAKADNWVMSLKMSTAGKFIDKNGNVYKRLKPMETKNVYANTGATVKFNRNVTVVKHEEPKPVVKVSTNKNALAQTILKGKAIDFINQGNYNVAKDLLDVIAELNKGE